MIDPNTATVLFLNATVWAELRASSIHGIGVFAIRKIPKGTLITNHTANHREQQTMVLVERDIAKLHPAVAKLVLSRTAWPEGSLQFIFPHPNTEQILQSFVNHSDEPNFKDGIALRDIEADEELVEDYRKLNSGRPLHPMSKKHWSFLK